MLLSADLHRRIKRRQQLFVFLMVHVLVVIYNVVFVLAMNMHHMLAIVSIVCSALDFSLCIGASVARVEHPTVGAAPLLTFAMIAMFLATDHARRPVDGLYVVTLIISSTLSILRVVYMLAIVVGLWRTPVRNRHWIYGGSPRSLYLLCRRGSQSTPMTSWERNKKIN